MPSNSWDGLASAYEDLSVREDSLDTLMDWPAQRRAVGDVAGKTILDLGCGSGRKAFHFATSGAKKVVGIDVSEAFLAPWDSREKPQGLSFFRGDLSSLEKIEAIAKERFDIVTCFQSIGYSHNLNKTVGFIRAHIVGGGRFILTTAHPLRFAVELFESRGTPYGDAYRDETEYTYPSSWDKAILISHSKPMISTYVNIVLANGFRLDSMDEPDLSKEQKAEFPHKAKWVSKYVGTIVYRFTAVNRSPRILAVSGSEVPVA